MPVFVRASRRAKAHTRGSRSKLAQKAKRLGISKLDALKSNVSRRYGNAVFGGGTHRANIYRRFHLIHYGTKLQPVNKYGQFLYGP